MSTTVQRWWMIQYGVATYHGLVPFHLVEEVTWAMHLVAPSLAVLGPVTIVIIFIIAGLPPTMGLVWVLILPYLTQGLALLD